MKNSPATGIEPRTIRAAATAVGRFPKIRLASPIAAAVFAALYPATLTFAQTQKSTSGRLEEIVVTATRRELDLQNVAQSVAAFSTADIEKQKFQSVEDVIGALPSVNLVNSQPGRNSIVMRGVSTGSSEYRTDSQVAIYLDDQPLTSISQQVDIRPIDIERIEAMPGPQGTLFGSSSQSGTLRYITNKPDASKFGAQIDTAISTTEGGEESYDVSGHVNIPVNDNFAVRVVGFYESEGGYVDNVLGKTLMGDSDNSDVVEKDQNDFKTWGGRIAARWQISPQWESTLSLLTQYSEADGAWESDPALGDYKITRFFDEWRDDNWRQESLNIKGDLGFAELSMTASYFDRKIKYEWDNTNYSQWRSAYYGYYGNVYYANGAFNVYNTGTARGTEFNDQKQNRWTYEVRLTSQGDSRFQWMAGAFYEDVYDWWEYDARTPNLTQTVAWEYAQQEACRGASLGYDIACPLPDTNVYYSDVYDKTVKQTAFFGEATFALTDRWSFTGGARWFQYDRDVVETYSVPRGLPVNSDFEGGGRNASKGKESDTVFKAATEFHFDADRMVYLLYSEGFRLGGNNSARAADAGFLPLVYEPDKLKNYEAGLKSQWFDDVLQVNVSLFFMQWDNIQLNTSGSNAGNPWWLRGTFNGGKAEQKGAEVSLSWAVTPHLNIDASAFFADPQFSEKTEFPDPGEGEAIKAGTVMPVSPKRKYFVSAEYTVPQFLSSGGDLWGRVSYSYQGSVWNDLDSILAYQDAATPEERQAALDQELPAWSTTTLQVGYTHPSGWETSLVVRNLFDEKGYDYLSTTDYGHTPNLDPAGGWGFNDPRWRYVRTLQRPREIGLTFTKKW